MRSVMFTGERQIYTGACAPLKWVWGAGALYIPARIIPTLGKKEVGLDSDRQELAAEQMIDDRLLILSLLCNLYC